MSSALFEVESYQRKRHPATYTDALLPVFVDMLGGSKRVLDPFGGTGKIFDIQPFLPGVRIHAVEIEPEWANCDPRIVLGNALDLPWGDNTFDAICTSPTYGNRMADSHNAQDDSRRNTYTHAIGRKLHTENSGQMQWGKAYREFHTKAWAEARRVLVPGGQFVLNIKDHFRAGERQHVTSWHCDCLSELGFVETDRQDVECPGQRYGANGGSRMDYESVILFRLNRR